LSETLSTLARAALCGLEQLVRDREGGAHDA
jgi:hypothetical protein